ncbi:30S ribosomal protein S20 [Patescibacteria group bacterium]|nr:30S ribosomal protein S20 [Patescibacteria group bacterium]
MPVKKAAFKDLRQSEKRGLINLRIKRSIKALIKDIDKALTSDKVDDAKKLADKLQKTIDKAIQHGRMKKNAGARKKSRVAARIKENSIKK